MNTSSFASTTTKFFAKEGDHETFTTEYIPSIIILLSLLFSNVLKMFQVLFIIIGPLCQVQCHLSFSEKRLHLTAHPPAYHPSKGVCGSSSSPHTLSSSLHPHPPLPVTLMTSEVDL